MSRKPIQGAAIVFAIFIVLAGIKAWQIFAMVSFGKSFVQPPETISSTVVREENWNDTLTAVGSIDPVSGTTLAPEVGGTVVQIAVADGSTVAKGDLLIRLDTSSEEAQLRAAEAQVDWARVSAERLRQLRTNNTVSQSEVDQAEATLKQAQANADNLRAIIDKKTIRAPFAGKLGLWLVNVGTTLEAHRQLVSLQSLTPVYADFYLPQQDLARLQTGLQVRVTTDAYPGTNFVGTLTAINPEVDATTRSVAVRGTFENAEQLLRPGMFVRVEVMLPDTKPVLAVPATALLRAPFGDSVYLILTAAQAGITNMPATNLVAQQKFVRTGRAHGDFISIESGLKAGDKVVTAGIFKLRNGASIQENNVNTPKPSLTPNPPNS